MTSAPRVRFFVALAALAVVVGSATLLTGLGTEAQAEAVPEGDYLGLRFDGSLDSNVVTVHLHNPGTAPLEIADVGTSCGVRVLGRPERPVQPGQTAAIELVVPTPATLPDAVAERVVIRTNAPGVFSSINVGGTYERTL